MLDDLLEEMLSKINISELDEIGCVGAGVPFFKPILREAVADIRTHAVAQALLMRAGKWAPDKELPEIES